MNFATDLVNPNFAKMAEAIGLFGVRVEAPEELEGALSKGFSHNGPALIDVVVNRFELSMPPDPIDGARHRLQSLDGKSCAQWQRR